MPKGNYICLNRSIWNNWIWRDPVKLQRWLDLLMLANYEDKEVISKGEKVLCKRGDVNLSKRYLARRWKCDKRTVDKFLNDLEKDGMVTTKCTTKYTTITIENYTVYQPEVHQSTYHKVHTTNKYNKYPSVWKEPDDGIERNWEGY